MVGLYDGVCLDQTTSHDDEPPDELMSKYFSHSSILHGTGEMFTIHWYMKTNDIRHIAVGSHLFVGQYCITLLVEIKSEKGPRKKDGDVVKS